MKTKYFITKVWMTMTRPSFKSLILVEILLSQIVMHLFLILIQMALLWTAVMRITVQNQSIISKEPNLNTYGDKMKQELLSLTILLLNNLDLM